MDTKKNEINLSSNKKCAELSFIKSPHNFWVRLEEYKNDYTEMLSKLQSEYSNAHEDPSLNVTSLSLGSLYCTFNQKIFEWQRCEALFINQSEVFISYLDIGQTDLIPVKSIKILKDEFQSIQRFALHCCLDRIESIEGGVWSPTAISVFSKLLMDKILTLTIKSKCESIYNVELFIKTQNIAEQLVKEGQAVLKQDLQQGDAKKTPLIKVDKSIEHDLTITCIYSPFCFYSQLNNNLGEFSQFELSLQEFYENALKKSNIVLLTKPQIGQICVAKYSEDEQWYRAIVKEVDHELNNVRVFFIDYGNEDVVLIDKGLLVINDQFKQYPCMALKCCLDGIKPLSEGFTSSLMTEIIDFMYNSLAGNVKGMFLGKQTDDCYLVKLRAEETTENNTVKTINISDLLIEQKYVLRAEQAEIKAKKYVPKVVNVNKVITNGAGDAKDIVTFKQYSKYEPELKRGETYEFIITYIETVSEFYVKLNGPKDSEESRNLANKLQYFYEKKLNLPQPVFETGNSCIYYDFDCKEWFRAEILNILDDNHCLIRLVDFGSTKYVNRTSLREIYDKFLEPVCQAALACLDGLADQKDEDVDEQIQFKFKEIALNKKFLGKVVKCQDLVISNDNQQKRKYQLNLFDENYESVYSVLVHNLDNSINVASDKFKPVVRSKLEESHCSMLELSQTSMLNDTVDYGHKKVIQKDILNDLTSPFPVHEENLIQKIPKSVSITLIETARKLDLIEPEKIILTENIKTQILTPVSHYESIQFNLDLTKPTSINISHYETPEKFYAQVNNLFLDFDSHFDAFQQSCSESTQIKLDQLVKIEGLDRLALGAKFYDDGLWYRARICDTIGFQSNHLSSTDDTKILIEFIDYGNCQMTSIKDCVYLKQEFSKFNRCAFKCDGLAYLEQVVDKISPVVMENLLFYGRQAVEDLALDKLNWETSYFIKKDKNEGLLVEIDDLFKLMFKLGLIQDEFYFNPNEYSEQLTKQDNLVEIKEKLSQLQNNVILDAKLTSIENGLKYIYFNLETSFKKLQNLEKELEEELLDGNSIKVNFEQIKINNFYLLKLKNRFYRSILLAHKTQKSEHLFQLIDYGTRVQVTPNITKDTELYILMPKYFKHSSYSLHCRLTLADNIEKVWTRDEKQKFFKQIQPGNQFKIKLLTSFEPYVIEFYDEQKSIDFQFNQIIARLNQTNSETQTILNGSKSVSLNESFYLAGDWLKVDTPKPQKLFISQNESMPDLNQLKFYLQSERLIQQLGSFSISLDDHVAIRIKALKKGDVYLARTTSLPFLHDLNPQVKDMISKHWSRVQVTNVFIDKQTSNKLITLFYIDYGLEDTIKYTESANADFVFLNYQLVQIPLQFKIWPAFLYECRLNKLELARKLNDACKLNDFLDSIYLNDSFESMSPILSKLKFNLDFTQSLLHPDLNTTSYTVDLIDTQSNTNLIDLVVTYSLSKIQDYYFPCVISHINSVKDFYIQKEDSNTQSLLLALQDTIQAKIAENKLNKLKTLETNKLCVSFYEDDGQYYRARILGFGDNMKDIVNFKEDLIIDVFFIDYGNTSKVKFSQLREITPDLVDRLPRSFSIKCFLRTPSGLTDFDIDEYNNFFFEIFETNKFLVKFSSVKCEHEALSYQVELYDSENQKNLTEMLKTRVNKELTQLTTSCAQITQFEKDLSVSLEDDKAIAETINDSTKIDDTAYANNTNNTTQVQDSFQVSNLPASNETLPFINNLNTTWEETDLHLRNYDCYEPTLNDTQNQSYINESATEPVGSNLPKIKIELHEDTNVTLTEENNDLDKTELYSTANSESMRFDADHFEQEHTAEQSVLTSIDTEEDIVVLKDCLISFMHSSNDLFIQQGDFEAKIAEIQPEIDACLDLYDLNKSKYCIGQYKADEAYYRCKVLDWDNGKQEAFVQFIDYGNREFVFIDTITKMSDLLERVKPLAFNCSIGEILELESTSYKQLEQLVNLEIKFDIRAKRADLDEFYARQEKPCPVEILLSSNGLKVCKKTLEDKQIWDKLGQEILDDDLNAYYATSCQVEANQNSLKPNRKDDDDDDNNDADSEPNFGSGSHFKTSTQLNLNNGSTTNKHEVQSSISIDSRKAAFKPDDTGLDEDSDEIIEDKEIIKFINQQDVDESTAKIPNKPEIYFYTPNNESQTQSQEINTTILNHNQTVDKFADQSSNWSINQSKVSGDKKDQSVTNLDASTANSNHNETVDQFGDQDTVWSVTNKTLIQDESCLGHKNLTVSRFGDQDSRWSLNESKADDKNLTVSRFADENSHWSVNNDETLNDKPLSESGVEYISRTVDENNASVWSQDPDQSVFDLRKRSKTTRSNLDMTRSEEEPVEHTRILNGNIIHVNSLDNFYFQAEDADEMLMNMKQVVDKCEKKFDKIPIVGQLCVTKYRVDGQFYRAQILDISGLNTNGAKNDPRLKVLYIDYGNEDYVNLSDIYKISKELGYIAPLAMKCSLGFTKKLENLITKLNESQKDSSEVIQYFKALTGRSKVTIKVRKQTQIDAAKPNFVDLFIRNENICDLLVDEVKACLLNQPEFDNNENNENNTIANKINIKHDDLEFDCYLLNLKKFSIEVTLRNENVLKTVDNLIESFNSNQTLCEIEQQETHCLAPLDRTLIQKYKLNNSYARGFIIERCVHSGQKMAKVKYTDLDYESWLSIEDLISTNQYLSQLQPGVDTYKLDLKNSENLSRLTPSQLEHLLEVFKSLVNYEPDSSSKLRAKFCKKNKQIRLFDTERENLDINTILELCIAVMTRPFIGKLTHLENDYSQFDCLHEASDNKSYFKEMDKLYRSSGLFDFGDEVDQTGFKIGQLCLVDHTINSDLPKSKRLSIANSDSILCLAEHGFDQQADLTRFEHQNTSEKDLFRGVILDETADKCVVLNVDTGRQLTITKRRLRPLNTDQSSQIISLIPFMLIKANTENQWKITSVQRLLHKSRYYGDTVKMNIIGNGTGTPQALFKQVELLVMEEDPSASPVITNSVILSKPKEENDYDQQFNRDKKKRDFFYKLSHAKSLSCFYIHTSDTEKQLSFINDQIELEANGRQAKLNFKNPPKLSQIYAVYSKKDEKFYRIRLLNHYVTPQHDDEVYQAFYIDYGYIERVHLNDLLQLSEQIQLIAPQAICCKLNGFQSAKSEFEDAESGSESESTNEVHLNNVFEMFKTILGNGTEFAATIYKQFSINKKISNFVPVQSDNTKPIEIVIHLFDLNNENLGDLLKKRVKLNTKHQSIGQALKKLRLEPHTEHEVELSGLISPNEFYLSLKGNQQTLADQSHRIKSCENELQNLRDNHAKKGVLCAFIKRNESIYRRGLITDVCLIKNQINIRLYLIDMGIYVFSGLENLYHLPHKFFDTEPLCFQASLNLDLADKETEYMITQKFKSLISLCKYFKIKIIKSEPFQLDLDKYTVNLSGSRSVDTNRQYNLNLNDELSSCLKTIEVNRANEKMIWDYVEKTTIYDETKLPVKQAHKVHLTNIDTAKHFGIVLAAQNDKRNQFLNKFHQWHKEFKKNLKLLIPQGESGTSSKYIGAPCSVSSVQIGKWCRGLVIQCDLLAQMSNVYLIDHCKTLTVTHDRMYKLENEEFLIEPTYVHRCQLQDDHAQREKFSKYIDLLKSNTTNNLLTPNNGVDRNDSLNSSHITIENIEINIECLSAELAELHPNINSLKNHQYTIKVNEIKRIRSPFPNSPHSILNNSSKIKVSHQQVKYESFYDETTENILSSTYKEHVKTQTTTTATGTSSSNLSELKALKTNVTSEQIYENDYQNDTFSAITESTRIQTFNDETNNGDQNGETTLCESNNYSKNRRRSIDKREETSNWIRDFEETDYKITLIKNDIDVGGPLVRVRVLPFGFSPNGFICQKLDLINSYERLQAAMNDYYQKITNASKSLERDKSDPRYNSLRSDFADSMDEDKSILNDLFVHSFHGGDYCAAYLGKSWARCAILDIDGKIAHVECVDDGRKQHVALCKLEKLSDNFKVMPRFSFRCKFAGLDSKKLLALDLQAIERFEKYLCGDKRELTADIKEVKEDACGGQVVYEVNLFMNNVNVISLWQKS